MSEDLKRQAAAMALEEVRPGMRLGLGTGSTARHFVDLLGARVAQGLDCIAVPTSEATAAQARALGIPLSDLDALEQLDLTVDGADELDADLNLIKGGGGALLREKIVAAASRRMVVIADAGKLVPVLGRYPLPIEVNGSASVRRAAPSRPSSPALAPRGRLRCARRRAVRPSAPMAATSSSMLFLAVFRRQKRSRRLCLTCPASSSMACF